MSWENRSCCCCRLVFCCIELDANSNCKYTVLFRFLSRFASPIACSKQQTVYSMFAIDRAQALIVVYFIFATLVFYYYIYVSMLLFEMFGSFVFSAALFPFRTEIVRHLEFIRLLTFCIKCKKKLQMHMPI